MYRVPMNEPVNTGNAWPRKGLYSNPKNCSQGWERTFSICYIFSPQNSVEIGFFNGNTKEMPGVLRLLSTVPAGSVVNPHRVDADPDAD